MVIGVVRSSWLQVVLQLDGEVVLEIPREVREHLVTLNPHTSARRSQTHAVDKTGRQPVCVEA